jgi:hypothetical protein
VALVVAALVTSRLLSASSIGSATTSPVVVLVGAATTEHVMDAIVAGSSAVDVHARQSPPVTAPASAFCGSVTYSSDGGTGSTVASPDGADEGRDALRDSASGNFPDQATGAGQGCIGIARSDAPLRSIGSSADSGAFEYYGFALDAVTWATTSLHAPPSLSPAQLQGIFACTYTDWSQVGGSPGPIQRVLPPDGSGVLDDFLRQDLGVGSVTALPASASGCPPIARTGEDEGYDLNNGSALYGPLADPRAYANAVLPFSAAAWTYEAAHATNPTLDLRAGVRPGELEVPQGIDDVDAAAIRWTGSTWQLDNSTVVGDSNDVRNVAGLEFVEHDAVVTSAPGTFQASDVGKTLDGLRTPDGNVITSVGADGSSATISPGAQSDGVGPAAIGYPIVSEHTIAGGAFPGVHYVYNVVDSESTTYAAALALVGFEDAPGEARSSLCDGTDADLIVDNGFLPLAPRSTTGGNTGVTCTRDTQGALAGTTWTAEDLDGPGVPTGAGQSSAVVDEEVATAAVVSQNHLHVFYSQGGHLRHALFDGTTWSFGDLSSDFIPGGATISAVATPIGVDVLFPASGDSHEHLAQFDGSTWTFQTTPLGANEMAPVYSAGALHVFSGGRHAWLDASGWHSENFDGVGSPSGGGRTTDSIFPGARAATDGSDLFVSYTTAGPGPNVVRLAGWNGSTWSFSDSPIPYVTADPQLQPHSMAVVGGVPHLLTYDSQVQSLVDWSYDGTWHNAGVTEPGAVIGPPFPDACQVHPGGAWPATNVVAGVLHVAFQGDAGIACDATLGAAGWTTTTSLDALPYVDATAISVAFFHGSQYVFYVNGVVPFFPYGDGKNRLRVAHT